MNANPSKDVIWREPSLWDRATLMRALRKELMGRVDEAYLVGSHARGQATRHSDIDLILVVDTKKAWPDRGQDFLDLFKRFGAVDLLVYRPEEWTQLKKNPTSFLKHAMAQSAPIFSPRVDEQNASFV